MYLNKLVSQKIVKNSLLLKPKIVSSIPTIYLPTADFTQSGIT